MFGTDRIVGVERIDGLDQLGAQLVAQRSLDLVVDLVRYRRVVLRVLHHEFAHHADAHAFQWLGGDVPSLPRKLAYGSLGISAFRDRREHVRRIEALDGVEHLRSVRDRSTVNAGAIARV